MTTRPLTLDDARIRKALYRFLLPGLAGTDAVLVNELGVLKGAYRVDVAQLGEWLTGYEIKSDVDSLSRLPAQVKAYDRVFNENVLVVGNVLHKKALTLVPPHWGVILAIQTSGVVDLRWDRVPSSCPNTGRGDQFKLLWRDELIDVIKAYAQPKGLASWRHAKLVREAVKLVPPEAQPYWIREMVKVREGWGRRLTYPETG